MAEGVVTHETSSRKHDKRSYAAYRNTVTATSAAWVFVEGSHVMKHGNMSRDPRTDNMRT